MIARVTVTEMRMIARMTVIQARNEEVSFSLCSNFWLFAMLTFHFTTFCFVDIFTVDILTPHQ